MKRRRTQDIGSVSVEGFGDLERIGSGGFSVVYRARQLSMNREVAIKVLNAGFATEAERRTFERECHALGQLSHHPNIVTVFSDAITTDGRPCIVMELYRTTYRQRIAETGPIGIAEALSTGVRVAGALHVAHTHGVLHRDIKPHNIFVSQYGEPALGDFGISTLDDERSHSGASGLSVAYAAPEILEDAKAEVTSDVYALAATLYHLVAGSVAVCQQRAAHHGAAHPHRDTGGDRPPRQPAGAVAGVDPHDVEGSCRSPRLGVRVRRDAARGPGAGGFELTPIPATQGDGAQSGASPAPVVPPSPNGAGTPSASGPPTGLRPPDPPIADDGPSPSRPAPDSLHRAAPGFDGDQGSSTHTVARARTTPPAAIAVDAPPRDRRRASLAAAGVLAAGLLLVVGVLAFGGNDGGDSPGTTVPATPPDIAPRLGVPTNVKVLRAENGFNVHFELPKSADGARIQLLSTSRQGETIEAPTSPHLVRVEASSLCVQVIATRTDGRISGASQTACSGG